MADRNFNQQSNQDWERERNRYNQDSDWMQNRNRGQQYGGSGYGGNQDKRDVGYSGDSAHGMGNTEDDSNYNRVNYVPDNDDNRGYNSRDYGNTQFGNSGSYGYQGSNRNEDWRRYGNENRGSYGNAGYGNDYGHQDWNRQRENRGNSWSSDAGWNRQQQSSGNWGNDYDRQDWGRGRVDTGNFNSDRNYGNRGENNYGGSYRSNYGNSGGYGNMGGDYNRDWSRNRNAGNQDRDYRRDDNEGWWDRTKDKVTGWFSSDDDDRNDRDRNRNYMSHRGKGPSDYRRSEDRIREDICDRLTDDDRVDASHISVQIDNDAVILSGTVNSREEKRRAEDLVESVSGVRNVENRLRVGSANALSGHDYTGNTDRTGGIGTESGTTNEIIRNVENERNSNSTKGRNKTT
ncbi:MAG TPA: BON domain-containing protein [Flavisolibacter sp.]|jgi:hypothetical protein|nr:BON domain-containing protein [Flavisolibacter sp.]